MARYKSSDPGDFDQQAVPAGRVPAFEGNRARRGSYGALGETISWEQAWPDRDYPPVFFDPPEQADSSFQGESADFGSPTLKVPARRVAPGYRNPFAYNLRHALPQGKPIQAQGVSGMGDLTEIFSSVKWIAIIGFTVFAYYKLREHKEDLKQVGRQLTSATERAREAFLKSNPSRAQEWADDHDDEADDKSVAHRFMDDDEE